MLLAYMTISLCLESNWESEFRDNNDCRESHKRQTHWRTRTGRGTARSLPNERVRNEDGKATPGTSAELCWST
jgi:hypothetical protein